MDSPGHAVDSFPGTIPFVIVQREPYRDRDGTRYFTVSFRCPYCFTSYRLDGRPRWNARHRTHYHGAGGDWDGSPTHRWAHCYSGTPFTGTGYFLVWEGFTGLPEFTEAAA